jgi:hypothetical protein
MFSALLGLRPCPGWKPFSVLCAQDCAREAKPDCSLADISSKLVRLGTGAAVPIYELLKGQGAFAPEELAVLGRVFEDVLQTLGLVDRQDPVTEMVAKKLVELGKAGVRDPDRLKALTLQAFTQQQQQQIQRKSG